MFGATDLLVDLSLYGLPRGGDVSSRFSGLRLNKFFRPNNTKALKYSFVICLLLIIPVSKPIAGQNYVSRIVSTNVCIDTLLVSLIGTHDLLAVSSLSKDERFSTIAHRVKGLKTVNFEAESIYPLKPDIIFASNFSSPRTRAALQKLGLRVELINYARSTKDIAENIRKLGVLLGLEKKAELLATSLEPKSKEDTFRLHTALQYSADNYIHGRNSLITDVITRSGFKVPDFVTNNLIGSFSSIERVIFSDPDLLILDQRLAYNVSNTFYGYHKVLRSGHLRMRKEYVDTRLWSCGSQNILQVINRLTTISKELGG
jgi:iron complex transport system substrate-binding protein